MAQQHNSSSNLFDMHKPCNVLLTGVTGFVGRYLLYQLCEAEWVDEIYVLIRSRKGVSPQTRFREVLDDVLFREAAKRGVNFDNITVISGDLLEPRLGMSEESIRLLSSKVSLVLHNAAALSFAQPILAGLKYNTKPAWELYQMCCNEFELKPAYILLSTIATNSHNDVVPEEITSFSGKAKDIYNFIMSIPDERSSEKAEWLREGRLDSYAFSKGITERMILEDIEENGGQIPVHIVRPGGIISAHEGPLPGWMHDTCFYGQLSYFVYKGKIPFFLAKRDLDINMAPVDMVGNLTLACSLEALEKRKQREFSVQVVNGSSIMLHGINFNSLIGKCNEHMAELEGIAKQSYKEKYDLDATHLFNSKQTKHPFYLQSIWLLEVLFSIIIVVPMYLFHLYEGDSKRYKYIEKLTNFLYKYVKVLAPYLTRKITIEHGHIESLHKKYGKQYPLDATNIDSDEFTLSFLKGVAQHIVPVMECRESKVLNKINKLKDSEGSGPKVKAA